MPVPDVCFFEAFEEEAAALRRHVPPHLTAEFTWKTIQEVGDEDPPAPIISLRTQSVIPDAWAGKLNAILTRSTGYDHITAYRARTDTPAACGYLPLYCNRAVAEQALTLWMALLRKLPQQQKQLPAFHRDGLTGLECENKVLAVVGVGNIGHEITKIGNGLGMHVLGVDLVQRWEDVTYMSADEALAAADIIVCSMNLTDSNQGYFNENTLSKAKPGALFVNIARGELTVPANLLHLLESGQLAGVGMDVYDSEPELAVSLRTGTPSDNPAVASTLKLIDHPRTICTPHNAFNTVESVERKSAQSMEQLQHLADHGTFLWPIPD